MNDIWILLAGVYAEWRVNNPDGYFLMYLRMNGADVDDVCRSFQCAVDYRFMTLMLL